MSQVKQPLPLWSILLCSQPSSSCSLSLVQPIPLVQPLPLCALLSCSQPSPSHASPLPGPTLSLMQPLPRAGLPAHTASLAGAVSPPHIASPLLNSLLLHRPTLSLTQPLLCLAVVYGYFGAEHCIPAYQIHIPSLKCWLLALMSHYIQLGMLEQYLFPKVLLS